MRTFTRVSLVVVSMALTAAGPARAQDGGTLQEPPPVAPMESKSAVTPDPESANATPVGTNEADPAPAATADAGDARAVTARPRPVFTTTVMSSPPPKSWEARVAFVASGQGVLPFEGGPTAAVDLRYADAPREGVGLALAADVDLPVRFPSGFLLGHVEAAVATERFRLTLYPAGTSRLRVGVDPLVGFGGGLQRTASWRPVGVRGDLRFGALELWAGVQAAAVANDIIRAQELVVSPLVSAAYRFHPSVRAEVRAGGFDRGVHPTLALLSVHQRALAVATSGRLEVTGGAEVSPIFDAWRYRDAAEFRDLVFETVPSDDRFGARGEVEVLWSRQTAWAPAEADSTAWVNGLAVVARGTARWHGFRLQLTGSLDTPATFWLDGALNDTVSGMVQAAAESMPAARLDAAAERCFGTFCPGLFLRLETPAAVRHEQRILGDNSGLPSTMPGWLVLRRQIAVSVLPGDAVPFPVLSATAGLRWQPLPNVQLRGDFTYARDPNLTSWKEDDGTGIGGTEFDEPSVFAVDLVVQVVL